MKQETSEKNKIQANNLELANIKRYKKALNISHNNCPELVEVLLHPKSCAQKNECENKGASGSFVVNIKFHPEYYNSSKIKFGIKSGKLVLNLSPLSYNELEPQEELLQSTSISIANSYSSEEKLSVKDPTMSSKEAHIRKEELCHRRIAWLGGNEKPYCYFEETSGQQLLSGISSKISFSLKPDQNNNCKCGYRFIVESDDLDYIITDLPKEKKGIFMKIKLKSYCEKRLIFLREQISLDYDNCLSKGEWVCLSEK